MQDNNILSFVGYIGLHNTKYFMYDIFDLCSFSPSPAKLSYLNIQLVEVVSHYLDPRLQVGENDSYLFNTFLPKLSSVTYSWNLSSSGKKTIFPIDFHKQQLDAVQQNFRPVFYHGTLQGI